MTGMGLNFDSNFNSAAWTTRCKGFYLLRNPWRSLHSFRSVENDWMEATGESIPTIISQTGTWKDIRNLGKRCFQNWEINCHFWYSFYLSSWVQSGEKFWKQREKVTAIYGNVKITPIFVPILPLPKFLLNLGGINWPTLEWLRIGGLQCLDWGDAISGEVTMEDTRGRVR